MKWHSKFFQAIQRQSEDDHQLEVQALQEKMKEALAALNTSWLKVGYRGQAALYGLPWIMIIGPSAAGKSTLLRHSWLHFPYSRHQDIEIKGFAGTRNCDWWFADEAIILDTAGRYTTDEDDQPEWFAFLDLLKKYRRRAPVNGVMVALSLDELLHASDDVIGDHVNIIRARLHELIQQLGVVFPVHVVLTKCDLLPGFQSYMQDLSADAREQIWGMTLDQAPDFSAMYEKLCALRMHKMSMQSDSECRMKVLNFPHVFKEACQKIEPFLTILTKHNPYQEKPDFKGLYFTSAISEKANAAPNHRQGFFIKQLFKKIIFVDKHLVHSQRSQQINICLQVGASVLSCVATIAAVLLCHSSYALHKQVYARVNTLVHDHALMGTRFSRQKWQSMLALHQEYIRLDTLTEDKTLNLHVIERLSRAKTHLLNAWMKDMQSIFMTEVSQYLEHDLKHQSLSWLTLTPEQQQAIYGTFYDHLKTYLMLSQPQSHMQKSYALPRLTEHWTFVMQHRYPELAASNPVIQGMVSTYIDQIQSQHFQSLAWQADDALIGQARGLLNVNPSADSVYVHMKSELHDQLGDTDLNTLLEGNAYGLFHSDAMLPRAFTHEHVNQDVMPAIDAAVTRALEGDWVLNHSGTLSGKDASHELKSHLRALYFQDYAQSWFDFLSSIQVRPFQSIDDAANKLALLQQPTGPFSALMQMIKSNVYISSSDAVPDIVTDKMPSALLVSALDGPFYALRRMTLPGEKMTVAESMNQYLHLIGRVHNDLSRLSHASNPGREAEAYARRVLSGSDTELSKAVSSLSFLLDASTHSNEFPVFGDKTRAAMEPLLLSAFEHAWCAVLKSTGNYLQDTWDAQVMSVYHQTLRHKFPFSKTSVDATLEDVSIFFRPGDGVLSRFYDEYLMPYMQWTRNGYVTQTWLGTGLALSDDVMQSLSDAKRISDGFFKSSGSEVELTFYVSPVPTPGVEEVIFDSNGQTYRYRNEPEEWRRFVWPGDSVDMGARLYISQHDRSEWAEVYQPGVWGLFHLLNAATLTREGGAQYLSQWRVKNDDGEWMNIRFKLRADKQHNIFEPGLLQHFALPEDLIGMSPVAVAHHEGVKDVYVD